MIQVDPLTLIRPRRNITGMSAILLPFTERGNIDWSAFRAHVARTAEAGLTPAVNMDTGYVNLLDDSTRLRVLDETRGVLGGGRFVAGAFVGDGQGDRWNAPAYAREIDQIRASGGTPVIFQSYGLTGQPGEGVVESYAEIGEMCDEFIAFELGRMFAPFGKVYDIATFTAMLDVRQCIGAKHSSLSRSLEWERIVVRDRRRPDFKVFTGNDLAIDMVMYGSDYLLGLSTFAPDFFARRDACWAAGDPSFYELNDLLQYLGFFAFRSPVPAYKHSAAQFLKIRGWIDCDETHPESPRRPREDVDVLSEIVERLSSL